MICHLFTQKIIIGNFYFIFMNVSVTIISFKNKKIIIIYVLTLFDIKTYIPIELKDCYRLLYIAQKLNVSYRRFNFI